jgi:ribonuclease Z
MLQRLPAFALTLALAVVACTAGRSASAQGFRPAAPLANDAFRVTLLGTGSPQPSLTRFGPGVLIEAGGQRLVIDAGRGGTQRLFQLGVRLGAIDAVFLTHLHSDHVNGLADLWLIGWLEVPYAQRKAPLRVIGPAGTSELAAGLMRAHDWDIRTRIADQNLPKDAAPIAATEIAPGVVYERDGVKVTAIEVDHGALIKPAFGYRVDFDGRSVVVSGDTRPSDNLVKAATGADLLVHQVAAAPEAALKSPVIQVILAHHTKPEEAGAVFARAKPKLAVFYHYVLLGMPPATEDDVLTGARKSYDGPLVLGEDLMRFVIAKDGVTLARP